MSGKSGLTQRLGQRWGLQRRGLQRRDAEPKSSKQALGDQEEFARQMGRGERWASSPTEAKLKHKAKAWRS